ncbi:unnamed protein product, partial [Hapterophycus canaliculatus]
RSNTPERLQVCFEHCSATGAAYMATQFGVECWCSREGALDYGRHGEGGICDYRCVGDESETCGGWNAFDLFKLWIPDAPLTDEYPEYLGCYADNKEDRVMTHKVVAESMTPTLCREHCLDKDAAYYGTQFGRECWCGMSDVEDDYERHGVGGCYMSCAGDKTVACG